MTPYEFDSGDLGSVKYSFIVITPRFIQIQGCCNYEVCLKIIRIRLEYLMP